MRFEPREETVVAVRERLKDWGFLLNEPSARELVQTMLASEAPAIAARARQSADAALRAMRKIHSEILELIWRSAEVAELAAPVQNAGAGDTPPATSPGAAAAGGPAPKSEEEPIDLARLVRDRLGAEIGGDGPKPAEDEPDWDKRPLIKRPRR